MMKLRHLFNNTDLAHMLLKNWDYDESSLELFQYYRISANAVYPFKKDDEIRLLRFCPTSEKRAENIAAELEFIAYLRRNHYPALEPVASKTGALWVQQATPWGDYYAGVFKRVPGHSLGESALEDDLVEQFGAALGRLHYLSSQYAAPQTQRWSHTDVLAWIETTLTTVSAPEIVFREVALLRDYFLTLPNRPGYYGLIHYDFELDNVFYDSLTQRVSVIDFDDAMYHWYGLDIEQALASLRDEGDFSDREWPQKQARFLEGYRTHFEVSNAQLAARPLFRRFANLYGYTRIARAVQEEWEHEPEWLTGLRQKLHAVLKHRSEFFGNPIHAG